MSKLTETSKQSPAFFDEDSNGPTVMGQDAPHYQSQGPTAVPVINQEPNAIKSIKYAKKFETQAEGPYQAFVQGSGTFFGYLGVIPCCCCSNPFHEVQQGNVGLITKFGELARVVDPGSTYVNIFSEKLHKVSIKTEVQDVPEQACLTKDNVIVYLKSVIYYNIVDPQKAVFAISDIHSAVSERTQTTLRDVVGARVLQDVIERREEIAEAISSIISETATEWGVNVESILIKDLRLSPEITQALSQAAQAKRIGESKIIQAKSEVEASRLMRESAKLLNSKVAVQMRYLDAMTTMAKTANSKVIFMPTSVDIDQSKDGIDDVDADFNAEEDALMKDRAAKGSSTVQGGQDFMKTLAMQEGFVREN